MPAMAKAIGCIPLGHRPFQWRGLPRLSVQRDRESDAHARSITLIGGTELNNQRKRLIEKYPHIAIASAWASADTDVFEILVPPEDRIE